LLELSVVLCEEVLARATPEATMPETVRAPVRARATSARLRYDMDGLSFEMAANRTAQGPLPASSSYWDTEKTVPG